MFRTAENVPCFLRLWPRNTEKWFHKGKEWMTDSVPSLLKKVEKESKDTCTTSCRRGGKRLKKQQRQGEGKLRRMGQEGSLVSRCIPWQHDDWAASFPASLSATLKGPFSPHLLVVQILVSGHSWQARRGSIHNAMDGIPLLQKALW